MNTSRIPPKVTRSESGRSLYIHPVLITLLIVFCSVSLWAENKWVGTWTAAQYDVGTSNQPPSPGLASNTFRQIVRVSIGGDTIRVKFSNEAGTTALTMNAVTIAQSTTGKDTINASTLKTLTFSGNSSVTINAKSTVTSDPIAFGLKPSMRVAITIYYGQVPSTVTGHAGARTPSYLLTGDKTTAVHFSGATQAERWYTINTIDVRAPETAGAVAVLGNSITDGYGLSGGLQNRWTDIFSERLLNNAATEQVGVLNLGIGGTAVAGQGTGGLGRYQRDILEQQGVRWFIIFYGVNDIGYGSTATTVINAYKQMITDAHAQNFKVYGATITPFNGHSYYTEAHEAVRSEVNAWIRSSGTFDGVIDFDKAVRNPQDTTKFQTALKNDWLHPNAAGYKALGDYVDLSLFTDVEVSQTPFNNVISIPGKVEMENYDVGGQNVSFYDNTSENQGGVYRSDAVDIDSTGSDYVLGYTIAGEWLEYSVEVEKTGIYNYTARIASTFSSGHFSLTLDGSPITGSISVPNTGEWKTYEEIKGTTSSLEAGTHTLRLNIDSSYFNIDWIQFADSSGSMAIRPKNPVFKKSVQSTRHDLLGRIVK